MNMNPFSSQKDPGEWVPSGSPFLQMIILKHREVKSVLRQFCLLANV